MHWTLRLKVEESMKFVLSREVSLCLSWWIVFVYLIVSRLG